MDDILKAIRSWLAIGVAGISLLAPAHAGAPPGYIPSPPEGANWCKYAEAFLWNRAANRPFRCATDKTPACVKYNNYGCLKHGPSNPYPGTPAPNGKQGAHDGRDGARGHAIFEHPKWSIAGSFRWFEHSTKDLGLKTAAQLANRYSPWCDTQGSTALKIDKITGRAWGRTCKDGQKPPASFRGPFCKQPDGDPGAEQCRVCNCPSVFVKSWLKGTNQQPDDELKLFGNDGRPTQLMQQIIANHTPWEIGYRPTAEIVQEGAKLFTPHP